MTLHGIGDATVFVENAAAYRETLERAGSADRLLQVFVDDAEHSKMSAALYPAALAVLRDWVESGRRPAVENVRTRCETMREPYGGDCRVLPDYVPQGWYDRVNPRGTEMQASPALAAPDLVVSGLQRREDRVALGAVAHLDHQVQFRALHRRRAAK
jgi:hypothetical protein